MNPPAVVILSLVLATAQNAGEEQARACSYILQIGKEPNNPCLAEETD